MMVSTWQELVFVTSNPGKAEQLSWHLGMHIPHQAVAVDEIQSLDLDEVVTKKAEQAYQQLERPVLVEDTSLTFTALGALPGPLIRWFFEELGNDGLCTLLNPYADRSAVAETCFAIYDGQTTTLFRGSRSGTIAPEPWGDVSFGWDPIFIPQGYEQSWGEMAQDELIATSMRRPAIQALEVFLHR